MLYKATSEDYAVFPEGADAEALLRLPEGVERTRRIMGFAGFGVLAAALPLAWLLAGTKLLLLVLFVWGWTVKFVFSWTGKRAVRAFQAELRAHHDAGRLTLIPADLIIVAEKLYKKPLHQLPDDLFDRNLSVTRQLVETFEQNRRDPAIGTLFRQLSAPSADDKDAG